jgi:haloalkane dehalogenase
VTSDAPRFLRTPDERFADLLDLPYEPRYLDVDGVRLARLDEGTGHPVVLVHGVPTWSYLWRGVLPPLLAAGLRTIAVDQLGFGRSDKPPSRDWFTYDRLVASFTAHLDALRLEEPITLVVHDWGGPVGLRWAMDHPEQVARLVLLDTGVFTGGGRPLSDTWQAFRAMVAAADELPIGQLVQLGTKRTLSDEEVAAYDAPFPSASTQAGPLALPLLIPLADDDPGAAEMVATAHALRSFERPTLVLWGEHDRVLRPSDGERLAAAIPGSGPAELLDGAHFVQEDAGAAIGDRIVSFVRATSGGT